MENKNYKIDATGQSLGRLATKIAVILRGKNNSDFAPNKDSGNSVIVKNILKLKITGKKMDQKKYFTHSGYLGSDKHIPMKAIWKTNPGEVLRRAVFGMLPHNKLAPKMIKRLKVED